MPSLPSLIDELRAARAADWKRARRDARLALGVGLVGLAVTVALSVLGLLA